MKSTDLGICKCGKIMQKEEFYSIHAIGLHCEYNPQAVKNAMKKLAKLKIIDAKAHLAKKGDDDDPPPSRGQAVRTQANSLDAKAPPHR